MVEKFKQKSQYGSTVVVPQFQEARVKIRKGLNKKDFERTVVHELVHVRFGGLSAPAGTAAEYLTEVGTEMMTRILLKERG